MLLEMFPTLFEKVSASIESKVQEHLEADTKNWKKFEKNMRSNRFAAEVRQSDADQKLKDYVTANNQYLRSKDIVTRVPSRSSDKTYTIKKLPDGRLACGCKDWQYKCSWSGKDCEHVKAAKSGMRKVANAIMARGAGLVRVYNKAEKKRAEGRDAVRAVELVHQSGRFR